MRGGTWISLSRELTCLTRYLLALHKLKINHDSDFVGSPCCAQFIVHKSRILARPREAYRRLLADLSCDIEPLIDGFALEFAWHLLFNPSEPEDDYVAESRCVSTYGKHGCWWQ